MTPPARERCALVGVLILGCATFLSGLDWGLASREADGFLFGSGDQAWGADEIVMLGGSWTPDANRAADADADPIRDRDHLVAINANDQQKAQIFRRYRLFSAQPDEMVTFMALAGMRGGSFDPRMYQYGGLWVYPVGAALRLAAMRGIGLVTLKSDLNFYLDHPGQFGRFYVVARAYSVAWGLVGIWAVYCLSKRLSSRRVVPIAAAACFALMPVVINGAHEAKPHLAGTVLVLLSALAATKYVETGRARWWAMTGALCGMALGMVLSAAVAFVAIPLMTLLRTNTWGRRATIMLAAAGIGVGVYCLTNPYVPLNLIRNPAVVRANLAALGQAKAIVGRQSDTGAIANARRLVTDGASILGGVIGLLGLLVAAGNRAWWARNPSARVVAILLGIPAALVLVQFALLAAGKPGEFGRFAMLPDVALMMVGVVLILSTKWGRLWTGPAVATLILLVGWQGLAHVAGFVEDASRPTATRHVAAQRLAELWATGARTLAIPAEPAPYCLPPIDFTRWKVLLLPADGGLSAADPLPDVIVAPVDDLRQPATIPGDRYQRTFVVGNWPWIATRVSWADKPFEILIRRDRIATRQP
ncbi:MAG TPA: glycosyltransferase family 39 protein [Tepidisphaeraceae bacterium]|jgi:hypothetical protein